MGARLLRDLFVSLSHKAWNELKCSQSALSSLLLSPLEALRLLTMNLQKGKWIQA